MFIYTATDYYYGTICMFHEVSALSKSRSLSLLRINQFLFFLNLVPSYRYRWLSMLYA